MVYYIEIDENTSKILSAHSSVGVNTVEVETDYDLFNIDFKFEYYYNIASGKVIKQNNQTTLRVDERRNIADKINKVEINTLSGNSYSARFSTADRVLSAITVINTGQYDTVKWLDSTDNIVEIGITELTDMLYSFSSETIGIELGIAVNTVYTKQ